MKFKLIIRAILCSSRPSPINVCNWPNLRPWTGGRNQTMKVSLQEFKAATQFISKTTLQPKQTQNSYNMAEVYFVWKTCSQLSFLQAPISSCTWLWRPSCRRAFYIYESLFTEKYDGISLIMTLETAHGLALSERFSPNGEANRP